MQENFVHREKLKRAERAVQLWKEGKPLHDIAELFGVQEKTIKQYLEEEGKKETKKGAAMPLTRFIQANTTLDALFSSKLEEGFSCVRCKRYTKREAGIAWENEKFICRGCYLGLTKEETTLLLRV